MNDAGVVVKDRDWGRRAFSAGGRRTIAALAEAMLSSETTAGLVPAPATLTERVANEFDLLIGAGSSDLRRGFVLLIFALEWLPLFILGEFSRASRLPLARRLAYLHGLEHHKHALIAALFVGFKLPLTLLAYELGDDLALSGFDRATIATPRRVRKLEVIEGSRDEKLAEAAGQGRR